MNAPVAETNTAPGQIPPRRVTDRVKMRSSRDLVTHRRFSAKQNGPGGFRLEIGRETSQFALARVSASLDSFYRSFPVFQNELAAQLTH